MSIETRLILGGSPVNKSCLIGPLWFLHVFEYGFDRIGFAILDSAFRMKIA